MTTNSPIAPILDLYFLGNDDDLYAQSDPEWFLRYSLSPLLNPIRAFTFSFRKTLFSKGNLVGVSSVCRSILNCTHLQSLQTGH